MGAQQIKKIINFFFSAFFFLSFLVSPVNFILFDQTINFANDLSWQKIFRGRLINWKIEKSRFLHLQNSYPIFYLISRYLVNV